jgi:L-lactate dehydrogenase (cytochrome)
MRVLNSIEDLRAVACSRIPRALFDYIDRGSYDELTWNRNRDDLRAMQLRQRVMVDVSQLSVATTVLGEPWKMPVALAPTGLTGFFHRDGEIESARAAQAAGVPFCLSTMSICSIEDVRSAVKGTFWFQLYLMRDRGFNEALIARALAARCSALMLTLDLPLQALRRRDPKNGLSVPPRLTAANAWEFLMRPRWLAGVLLGRRRSLGNLASFFPERGIAELSEWVGGQFDPSITWKDVAWVRERWPGKLIVKGILDAEDARLACANGVDAIVVSNHGGRQLDGTTSTIAALPRVVDAAGRCEVLLDGGVTSGQDVLKALAQGARACLIGKAFLYGLAADGARGVTLALDILRKELEISMALCGEHDVRNVDSRILVR